MSEERTVDYYEDNLNAGMDVNTPPPVRTLVEDMIIYAISIPSTTSRRKTVRPGTNSEVFRSTIESIQNSVIEEFYALLNEFLAYIVEHEIISGWVVPE